MLFLDKQRSILREPLLLQFFFLSLKIVLLRQFDLASEFCQLNCFFVFVLLLMENMVDSSCNNVGFQHKIVEQDSDDRSNDISQPPQVNVPESFQVVEEHAQQGTGRSEGQIETVIGARAQAPSQVHKNSNKDVLLEPGGTVRGVRSRDLQDGQNEHKHSEALTQYDPPILGRGPFGLGLQRRSINPVNQIGDSVCHKGPSELSLEVQPQQPQLIALCPPKAKTKSDCRIDI